MTTDKITPSSSSVASGEGTKTGSEGYRPGCSQTLAEKVEESYETLKPAGSEPVIDTVDCVNSNCNFRFATLLLKNKGKATVRPPSCVFLECPS